MKFILIVFLILTSCFNGEPKDKNVLHLSIPSEITTIDPTLCFDTICTQVVYQVYESLYEYDYLKRPYVLKPLLAEAFPDYSADKKTILIRIKKNISYHRHSKIKSPRIVKAEDFITAFKRLAFKPSQSRGWWLFDQKIIGLNEWREKVGNDFSLFKTENISGLKALDDFTLQIQLKNIFPQLQYALTMPFISPIPMELLTQENNLFISDSIGTGPFILGDYHPSQTVLLNKNEAYHVKGVPSINSLRINVMKEAQTSWLNFNAQKIDVLNLTKDDYQIALNPNGELNEEFIKKNINLQISPTLIYWWFAFNMNDPFLGKNTLLRQAIAHAIDRDKFIRLFTYQTGQKANSIYPPGIPGFDKNEKVSFEYNLDKAKELLTKAGFPQGKGLPAFTFDVRGNSAIHRQMAEFVKQELQLINIDITISTLPFPQFLEKARKGELQFWFGGWVMDYPDAENTLQLLTKNNFAPGPNYSFYSHPDIEKWIEKLSLLSEGEEKWSLMKKINHQIQSDLPWVMLYYSRNYILSLPRVKNFVYSDIIYNYPKYISIE